MAELCVNGPTQPLNRNKFKSDFMFNVLKWIRSISFVWWARIKYGFTRRVRCARCTCVRSYVYGAFHKLIVPAEAGLIKHTPLSAAQATHPLQVFVFPSRLNEPMFLWRTLLLVANGNFNLSRSAKWAVWMKVNENVRAMRREWATFCAPISGVNVPTFDGHNNWSEVNKPAISAISYLFFG